jgi:hypothetical protein
MESSRARHFGCYTAATGLRKGSRKLSFEICPERHARCHSAISIDDELMQAADEAVRLMGLSRSRLFSLAVGDFLQRREREEILAQLDAVYAEGAKPLEGQLLQGIKARVRQTVKERWLTDCAGSSLFARFRPNRRVCSGKPAPVRRCPE